MNWNHAVNLFKPTAKKIILFFLISFLFPLLFSVVVFYGGSIKDSQLQILLYPGNFIDSIITFDLLKPLIGETPALTFGSNFILISVVYYYVLACLIIELSHFRKKSAQPTYTEG